MAEMLVALVIFGITLSGLFPLLVKHTRQVLWLEKCSPTSGRWTQNPTNKTWAYQPNDPSFDIESYPLESENRWAYPHHWNLVPADDPWAWNLGAMVSVIPNHTASTTADFAKYDPAFRPFPFTPPTSASLLADDSNPANTETVLYGTYAETSGSTWIAGPSTNEGYLNSSRRHATGTESWAATWTFKNVQPGWYKVWVTWPNPTLDPKPEAPNNTAVSNVKYQMRDGANTILGTTATGGLDQSQALTAGNSFDGRYWICAIGESTPIFVPMRVVENSDENYLTTTDSNGNSVNVYNGDTVTVQIQVPATPAGFVTADGVRLEKLSTNHIVRAQPFAWTWGLDEDGNEIKTLSTKVTITTP